MIIYNLSIPKNNIFFSNILFPQQTFPCLGARETMSAKFLSRAGCTSYELILSHAQLSPKVVESGVHPACLRVQETYFPNIISSLAGLKYRARKQHRSKNMLFNERLNR